MSRGRGQDEGQRREGYGASDLSGLVTLCRSKAAGLGEGRGDMGRDTSALVTVGRARSQRELTVLNLGKMEADKVRETPRRMSSWVLFRHRVWTTGKDGLTRVLPGQAWLYLHSPSVPSLPAAGSRAGSRSPAALAPWPGRVSCGRAGSESRSRGVSQHWRERCGEG